jgi:hypothetical protein
MQVLQYLLLRAKQLVTVTKIAIHARIANTVNIVQKMVGNVGFVSNY